MACSWCVAFGLHGVVFLVLASHVARHGPDLGTPEAARLEFIWLGTGPGGGRGSGGSRSAEPPRPLERQGRDGTNVPAAPSRSAASNSDRKPDPVDHMTISAQPLGAALASLPGKLDAPAAPDSDSRGTGAGTGFGTDVGSGDGSRRGSGIGDGADGSGIGDVYGPGSGVTMPVAVYEQRPRYTSAAMHARVQGAVIVECVVRPNGTCSDIRVVRSLDPRFGLDEEAVRAAALWRFKPGLHLGRPVPVRVRIELDFALR